MGASLPAVVDTGSSSFAGYRHPRGSRNERVATSNDDVRDRNARHWRGARGLSSGGGRIIRDDVCDAEGEKNEGRGGAGKRREEEEGAPFVKS